MQTFSLGPRHVQTPVNKSAELGFWPQHVCERTHILGDGDLLWVLLLVDPALPKGSPLHAPLRLLFAISALHHLSRTHWLLLTS